jgi:hypothetical protein
MCLVVPAYAFILILGFLEAFIIAQWARWSPEYKMWNERISMHTRRCRQQSLWNWGLLSLSADILGFLKYELHIKGTVLCFWTSLRCIKSWIVIYYRGLKFPPKISGSPSTREWCCMYQFHCRLCKKNCSFGLSMMLQSHGWYRTRFVKVLTPLRLHYTVVWWAYRWWLSEQEVWAAGAIKQWHCCILYFDQAPWTYRVKTQDSTHYNSHHWRDSPFKQQITLCFLFCVSGLWAFYQAVLFLMNVFATNVWSCLELDLLNIIHILGFITLNFLPICFTIVAALPVFQAWI